MVTSARESPDRVPGDIRGWRTRQRGVFEGLPRLAYQRTGRSYVDPCALGTVLHGVAVAAFGLVMVTLYVDLSASELTVYALGLLAAYVIEGMVAAAHVRRGAAPLRAWLAGAMDEDTATRAWSAAAQLPVAVLRRVDLYVLGALGAVAVNVLLSSLLGLSAGDAARLLPLSGLLYLSSVVLRYVGLELGMRPPLEALGEGLSAPSVPSMQVSLHWRLVAAVPTVTWASGVIVAGLLTENTRRLDRLGAASLMALAVAAAVSVWLSLVLADAVSGPVVDLRDATRRVAAGDLSVRVPVVSTDETGQLAESFNVMVAGLDERERLRDALGVLVDPALPDRVLAEGTDLRGEELDATILFLDVRDFTAFAETAAPQDVVTALNTLYDLVVPLVLRHGGHANRFLGDGLLAVFGVPERHPDHAARAVSAAHEIAALVGQNDGSQLQVGMGLSTGRVVAGTIGGGGRRDFTVIGDAVNTAARVEALTRETGDDILITETTWRALPAPLQIEFEERPEAPLKGKSSAVRLFGRPP
ncbi:MAG: adenylate cyclase [Actinomycetota bacterium]|nr:adenylate cyclase [Actinomycetota bacterium]